MFWDHGDRNSVDFKISSFPVPLASTWVYLANFRFFGSKIDFSGVVSGALLGVSLGEFECFWAELGVVEAQKHIFGSGDEIFEKFDLGQNRGFYS